MITIWKFPLKMAERQIVAIPLGSVPLCVQNQGETPCLWAEVSTEEPKMECRITIVGTGTELPEDAGRYVGTTQSGSFVWHWYANLPWWK